MTVKSVAIIGFGEGGRYLAESLKANSNLAIAAQDAGLSNPDVAKQLQAEAQALDVDLHAQVGAWLLGFDVVFSLVPGTVAVEVATLAAAHMKPGSIFVDLNSITGDMVRDAARPISHAGLRMVDGSVLGNFQGGNKVPVLLVGDGATEVENLMPADRFIVDIIAGEVGDASAIKMLRSVLMKGLEALCVECLVAAEKQGVTETLFQAFKDLDERPFVRTLEIMTVTHIVHAERRMKEVERVSSVLEKDGVRGLMTEATYKLFKNTVDSGIRPDDGKVRPLPETLAMLDTIYSTSSS